MFSKIFIFIMAKLDNADIADVLFINFLVLKLVGVITWSWWLVCLPLIIYAGIYFILLIIAAIMEKRVEKLEIPDPGVFMDRMGFLLEDDDEDDEDEE